MDPSDSSASPAPLPPEERHARLSRLRIDPETVTRTPLVVRAGQHFVLSSANPLARQWLKPFPAIETLDELKTFIGVPDAVHQNAETPAPLPFPDAHHSSLEASDTLELLDAESTAYKVGVNLVYGPTPVDAAQHEGVQHLVKAMTGALEGQYLVAGSDLTVAAGAVVDLGPNPTVTFDTITIHGDGAIITHNHQKVIAGVVQWLPN